MNMSLYFSNLTEDEILKILEVVSVPYLMEPLKGQPEKYLAGKKNMQSLSREAVNHIYLQFLRQQDPVLSLYLSDIVVDIIHYFKLSDAFKNLLVTDDPNFVDELKKKIRQRQCPITVDMFMRLLDRKNKRKPVKKVEPPKQEAKFFNIEEKTETKPELQKEETQEAKFYDVEKDISQAKNEAPVEKEEIQETEVVEEPKFYDVEKEAPQVIETVQEEVTPIEERKSEMVEETPTEEVVETTDDGEIELYVEEDMPEVQEDITLVEEQKSEETMTSDETEKEEVDETENSDIEDEEVQTEEDVNEETSDDKEEMIRDLQYQIMNLQIENQSLKEENRNLLFETDDENEIEVLRRELNSLKDEKVRLKKDVTELSMSNTNLQNDLRDYDDYKKKHNQVLLELRDYKIKYISLQAEVDQLRYTMKNDSKKLKQLQNKQRSVYDNQSDWMMAMHDLTWYKKQWNLPGDAPIHKIWAHLNREEAKTLAHLLKNFDRLLRTERKKEIDNLKEILIVKEAILILLRSDKAMENAKDKAEN